MKQRINNQDDKSSTLAYYSVSGQTLETWKQYLTESSKALKRKRNPETHERSKPESKKIKYESGGQCGKQELFSKLYGEESANQTRTKLRVEIRSKYENITDRIIKKWYEDFNRLAAQNNPEAIASEYLITSDKAKQWLKNYSTKTMTTVRKGKVDEVKAEFFTHYFCPHSGVVIKREVTKDAAGELIREKYPGTTYRDVANWMSEWKKTSAVRSADPKGVSKKYNITEDMAKAWLKGYQEKLGHKVNLAHHVNPEKVVCQYFNAIYTTKNIPAAKDKTADTVSKSTGASIRMLKSKRRSLEGLIADEKSEAFIASTMSLPLEGVTQWVKVIQERRHDESLRAKYKVKVFEAMWSDPKLKSIASVAKSIAEARFKVDDAQRWCKNFKEVLRKYNNDFAKTANFFSADTDQVKIWVENMDMQTKSKQMTED